MYSENDWRDYLQHDSDNDLDVYDGAWSDNDFKYYLEHREASKYGTFQWGPGGANSSEYNHVYYENNRWRWGVGLFDAVKDGIQNLLDQTELDEQIAGAVKNVLDSTELDDQLKEVVTNNKAVKAVTSALKESKDAKKQLNQLNAHVKNGNRDPQVLQAQAKAQERYNNTLGGKIKQALSNIKPIKDIRSGKLQSQINNAIIKPIKDFSLGQTKRDTIKYFKTNQIGKDFKKNVLDKTTLDETISEGLKTFGKAIKTNVLDKTTLDEKIVTAGRNLYDNVVWNVDKIPEYISTKDINRGISEIKKIGYMLKGDEKMTNAYDRFISAKDEYQNKSESLLPASKYSTGKTDSSTGFALQDPKGSIQYDADRTNPWHNNWEAGTKNNCVLCAITYNLRRNGYDVEAKNAFGMDFDTTIRKCFPGAEIHKLDVNEDTYTYQAYSRRANEYYDVTIDLTQPHVKGQALARDIITNNPPGSRGVVRVGWDSCSYGHAFSWEITNSGRLILVEPQLGTIYNYTDDVFNETAGVISWVRLDDAEIDSKNIKRCAKSYGT